MKLRSSFFKSWISRFLVLCLSASGPLEAVHASIHFAATPVEAFPETVQITQSALVSRSAWVNPKTWPRFTAPQYALTAVQNRSSRRRRSPFKSGGSLHVGPALEKTDLLPSDTGNKEAMKAAWREAARLVVIHRRVVLGLSQSELLKLQAGMEALGILPSDYVVEYSAAVEKPDQVALAVAWNPEDRRLLAFTRSEVIIDEVMIGSSYLEHTLPQPHKFWEPLGKKEPEVDLVLHALFIALQATVATQANLIEFLAERFRFGIRVVIQRGLDHAEVVWPGNRRSPVIYLPSDLLSRAVTVPGLLRLLHVMYSEVAHLLSPEEDDETVEPRVMWTFMSTMGFGALRAAYASVSQESVFAARVTAMLTRLRRAYPELTFKSAGPEVANRLHEIPLGSTRSYLGELFEGLWESMPERNLIEPGGVERRRHMSPYRRGGKGGKSGENRTTHYELRVADRQILKLFGAATDKPLYLLLDFKLDMNDVATHIAAQRFDPVKNERRSADDTVRLISIYDNKSRETHAIGLVYQSDKTMDLRHLPVPFGIPRLDTEWLRQIYREQFSLRLILEDTVIFRTQLSELEESDRFLLKVTWRDPEGPPSPHRHLKLASVAWAGGFAIPQAWIQYVWLGGMAWGLWKAFGFWRKDKVRPSRGLYAAA